MKRIIVKILVKIIYLWGSIWYDNKYFKGKFFNKDHFSIGWKWILKYWFKQKVLGYAKEVPFPIPNTISISAPQNIIFDCNDMDNFYSKGCYFQAINAKIKFGKCVKIAPNCGFITTNHDFDDLEKHQKGKDIIIKDNCWIGMNSVILPGVILGEHTIVGAGSIVTKSFEEGHCIIAGNPARKIKELK